MTAQSTNGFSPGKPLILNVYCSYYTSPEFHQERWTNEVNWPVLINQVEPQSQAAPLRVMSHPDGSEILFTVRQLDLTDEEFDRDCATVREDLERLVKLVENQSSR